MSLQVTLSLCLIAQLVHSVPYIKYGRFPSRGVVTVNTGFGIGGRGGRGGLATGMAAQMMGQTANNRLTVAYRPAGSLVGYTTLGSILGSTAMRPTIQTSGSAAQNSNALASLQVIATTANSRLPNRMQGGLFQGPASHWQNGAAGGAAGQGACFGNQIGAAGGAAGQGVSFGNQIGAGGGAAGQGASFGNQILAAGGAAGQIGASFGNQIGAAGGASGQGASFGNQIGAISSNGASSNQASWTRPSSAGSLNWQSGISASASGQWMANPNSNNHPGQSGGSISSGASQNSNELTPAGGMQAGMNGQVSIQHAGASSAGAGMGTSGREDWASQGSSQAQGLPTGPTSSNLQINANGQLTTSKNTGISVNAQATIGSTASSSAGNRPPSAGVSRPSAATNHNFNLQGGISVSLGGQSGTNTSPSGQLGGGSSTSQSVNGVQASSNEGINSNTQETWNMPTQTASSTQVLPARPSVGNVQINANGQLTFENTANTQSALSTSGSHQPSRNPQSHGNEQDESGQREQSGQAHLLDGIADWWGLGQIDDYPERGPVYVGEA